MSSRYQNVLILKRFSTIDFFANVMLFSLYNLINFVASSTPLLQFKKVAFEFAMEILLAY